MADNSQHPLWCSFCEVLGHPVTHCHALYEDLTTFAAALQLAQGPASDHKRPYDAAHWGQGKKNVFRPIPSIAQRGGPVQGPYYHSTPSALLDPSEVHALANYLCEQRASCLHCHAMWSLSVAGQAHYQHQGTQTDDTEQGDNTEGNDTL